MFHPHKMKALQGILDHMATLMGHDLKAPMDMPMDKHHPPHDGNPLDPKIGIEHDLKKPEPEKGIESMAKKEDSHEPPKEVDVGASDDEMDELYKKFRR